MINVTDRSMLLGTITIDVATASGYPNSKPVVHEFIGDNKDQILNAVRKHFFVPDNWSVEAYLQANNATLTYQTV